MFENTPLLFISSSSLKLQRIKAEKAEITRFFQKPKTPQAPKVSKQRFPLAFVFVSVGLLLLKTKTVSAQPARLPSEGPPLVQGAAVSGGAWRFSPGP